MELQPVSKFCLNCSMNSITRTNKQSRLIMRTRSLLLSNSPTQCADCGGLHKLSPQLQTELTRWNRIDLMQQRHVFARDIFWCYHGLNAPFGFLQERTPSRD